MIYDKFGISLDLRKDHFPIFDIDKPRHNSFISVINKYITIGKTLSPRSNYHLCPIIAKFGNPELYGIFRDSTGGASLLLYVVRNTAKSSASPDILDCYNVLNFNGERLSTPRGISLNYNLRLRWIILLIQHNKIKYDINTLLNAMEHV